MVTGKTKVVSMNLNSFHKSLSHHQGSILYCIRMTLVIYSLQSNTNKYNMLYFQDPCECFYLFKVSTYWTFVFLRTCAVVWSGWMRILCTIFSLSLCWFTQPKNNGTHCEQLSYRRLLQLQVALTKTVCSVDYSERPRLCEEMSSCCQRHKFISNVSVRR